VAQGRPPFAFAVKGEELPRRLEWSSFSRELPLFPSTIVLRKPRLRLDEHVHAHPFRAALWREGINPNPGRPYTRECHLAIIEK
jgi:hypothetical protein